GTEFGIIMIETSENILSVSFRSRTGFDVSKVANEVGGGGHKAAAGARIEGLPFQEAVNKVLTVARKYVQKN
ncbi:TPA: phosphoesterase, partial [Candidatus Woesebacteria bacterium]|nr:phosphoesterase [Candidatus Woesebacteria bacterium]